MSVSYANNGTYIPTDPCPICYDPLGKLDRSGKAEVVVAHSSDQDGINVHPIHKKCIALWIHVHPSCPCCRKDINTASVVSWKERVVTALEQFGACLSGWNAEASRIQIGISEAYFSAEVWARH